ncbi:uncharacterized protein PgNI_04886 [Pyricularia grisea]|uniref:Uncharacterized protein n=1 Tax=Pyricularia grisea TaxID=148305 RepID=A0A6P8BCM8_PYRGI|nr:uncharacterized protein PgNI_04886 [Pyricularia grisea]TLD13519.1 hypothetical protein PgNI_04886 [Pyricularia grisea]
MENPRTTMKWDFDRPSSDNDSDDDHGELISNVFFSAWAESRRVRFFLQPPAGNSSASSGSQTRVKKKIYIKGKNKSSICIKEPEDDEKPDPYVATLVNSCEDSRDDPNTCCDRKGHSQQCGQGYHSLAQVLQLKQPQLGDWQRMVPPETKPGDGDGDGETFSFNIEPWQAQLHSKYE